MKRHEFYWSLFLFLFLFSIDFVDRSTKVGDFEICVQWFQPELDCMSVGDPEDTPDGHSQAELFGSCTPLTTRPWT